MNLHKPHSLAGAVDTVIKKRRTFKVMGDFNAPTPIPKGFAQRIEQAMKVAGEAPYHYPANAIHLNSAMDSPVPWRFYALQQNDCLNLAEHLIANGDVSSEQAGIIRMLSAAGTLVLTTWLPEPSTLPEIITEHKNTEHIAAASAAIQNLLLAATARNVQTYWSSGGALGGKTCYDLCGIAPREKLLGAIFMFPQAAVRSSKAKPGSLHDKRGDPDQWRTWRTLSPVKSIRYTA